MAGDGGRQRWDERRDNDVVVFGESGDTGLRRWRRWWPLVAVAAAVVAFIAYSTQGGGPPTSAPSSPSANVTRVTDTSSGSPSPSAPASPPRITAVGGSILGITEPWELFAIGPGGVVRIRFAAGQVVRTPFPPLLSTGPAAFIVGRTWAMIRPLDRVPGYLIRDGQPAGPLTGLLANGGVALPGTGDNVWLSPDAAPRTMQLIGIDGRSVGPSITIPITEGSVGADGTGYVIAYGNGAYLVRPGGQQPITTGVLAAVGPTRWLVADCAANPACPLTVIDRATGQHRVLPGLSTEIGDSPVPGVVSPDGTWAAVYGSNAGSATQVHLINLTTSADRGLDIDLRGFEAPGMLAWSPDDKWLFVIGNRGVLYAYNVDTAHLTDFGVLVPPVDQIVVRDVAG